MSYVSSGPASRNGNGARLPIPAPDITRAIGELGKHFVGKLSGLGDAFKVVEVAGNTRLGAVAAPTSAMYVLMQRLNAQRLAEAQRRVAAMAPAPTVTTTPVVRQISTPMPVSQVAPAPSVPPPTVADRPVAYPQPFISESYGGAPSGPATMPYGGGNGGAPPVEIGTLPSNSGGMQMAGMFGSMNPMMLLALAGVGFFLMNQKKGR